jgi:1,4-dihydroxy-6-naphthoate synthase
MKVPLRIGISPCPNDIFVFSGAILGRAGMDGHHPLRIEYLDVEALNEGVRHDVFDVAKISYANYIHVADEYELLDCGGALGRGVGPLLLTHGTNELDPDRPVLIPGENTTAHFLLDFYLQKSMRKEFLPFDSLYQALRNQRGAQGVVIHEKRFTYERDGLTLLQDLGEHWEARTGFPIPLGAIVVRRSLDLRQPLERMIRQSIEWADDHSESVLTLCRQHAQEMNEAVIRAHIDLYVNEFTRDLGNSGRAAVDFFLSVQRQQATRPH